MSVNSYIPTEGGWYQCLRWEWEPPLSRVGLQKQNRDNAGYVLPQAKQWASISILLLLTNNARADIKNMIYVVFFNDI